MPGDDFLTVASVLSAPEEFDFGYFPEPAHINMNLTHLIDCLAAASAQVRFTWRLVMVGAYGV